MRYSVPPIDDGTVRTEAENLWKMADAITDQQADNYTVFGPVDKVRNRANDLAEMLLRAVGTIEARQPKPADLARTNQNAQKARSQTLKKKPDYTHSEDYTSVVWDGKTYQFTKTQALCVKYLWAEWEKREGLGLSEKTIGEKIGSAADNYKLKHTFRVKRNNKSHQHPAWGKMIVPCSKGMFRLKSSRKSESFFRIHE